MVQENLRTKEYYLDKLTMFLSGCHGIEEQFEIFIDILISIDTSLDEIFSAFNITDNDVFMNLVDEAHSNDATVSIDILNKIGELYGVSQSMPVTYVDIYNVTQSETLHLTPFEFWLLIKTRILQNNFDGTYGQVVEYYNKMNIPMYIFTNSNQAEALCVLNISSDIIIRGKDEIRSYSISSNIEKLFRSSLFTIKSMGISYKYDVIDIVSIAIWDSTDANKAWDVAKWGA